MDLALTKTHLQILYVIGNMHVTCLHDMHLRQQDATCMPHALHEQPVGCVMMPLTCLC
jgi:hypothetical protein